MNRELNSLGNDILDVYSSYYSDKLYGFEDSNVLQVVKLNFLKEEMGSELFENLIGLTVKEFEKSILNLSSFCNSKIAVDEVMCTVRDYMSEIEGVRVKNGGESILWSVTEEGSNIKVCREIGLPYSALISMYSIDTETIGWNKIKEFLNDFMRYIGYSMIRDSVYDIFALHSIENFIMTGLRFGNDGVMNYGLFCCVPVEIILDINDCSYSNIEKIYDFFELLPNLETVLAVKRETGCICEG